MSFEEDAASKIVQFVKNSPNESISGSLLGGLMNWSKDERGNLKQFIRNHVPEIEAVQSSPTACFFRTRPSKSKLLATHPESWFPQDVWKTFTSPHTAYKLQGHAVTGELRVILPSMPLLEDPWKEVLPCSETVHQEIAEAFLGTLSAEDQETIAVKAVLKEHGIGLPFQKALAESGFGERWQSYRTSKLRHVLRGTLRENQIPYDSWLSLQNTPVSAEMPRSAPVRPQANFVNKPRIASQMLQPARRTPTGLRRIAIAAVERMTVDDLRQLRFSLGSIIDILDEQ